MQHGFTNRLYATQVCMKHYVWSGAYPQLHATTNEPPTAQGCNAATKSDGTSRESGVENSAKQRSTMQLYQRIGQGRAHHLVGRRTHGTGRIRTDILCFDNGRQKNQRRSVARAWHSRTQTSSNSVPGPEENIMTHLGPPSLPPPYTHTHTLPPEPPCSLPPPQLTIVHSRA